MSQVLIVDRDSGFSECLARRLREAGFTVQTETDVLCRQPDPTAALALLSTDLLDPPREHLLAQLPTIAYARLPDPPTIVRALRAGAMDFVDRQQLESDITELVTAAMATVGNRPERPTLVGNSPAIDHIRWRIARVAPTPTTVLIQGATGTGKDLIARTIHQQSGRAPGGAFMSLNCATLPPNRCADELFGVAPTTGPARPGLLEAADGGTLLLDHVDELPLETQAGLLRVVEGPSLQPPGTAESRPVDVRLIATAQRDLSEHVRRGRFREDLFHRLNSVEIHTPMLRDIPEDIDPIADHLVQRPAARAGGPKPELSPQARDALRSYHWPGNVRELAHALERAVLLCPSDTIRATDLAIDVLIHEPLGLVEPLPGTGDGRTSLNDYFVDFVLGNQDQMTETELAQRLGISRKSLWERRQRMNIPRKSTRRRGLRAG